MSKNHLNPLICILFKAIETETEKEVIMDYGHKKITCMCLEKRSLIKQQLTFSKSLYTSYRVSNFYTTEIQIWAGFGPVGNTEEKVGPILSNF